MEDTLIAEIAEHARNRNIEIHTVFDCGAHNLDEAICTAEIFPESTIHSFEANPNNFPGCNNRAAEHDRIYFYECGVGAENTTVPFYITDGSRQSSVYQPIIGENNAVEMATNEIRDVKIIRLDSLDIIPDLLFMDVQGSEYNALIGLGEHLDRIKIIATELIIEPVLYSDAPLFDDVDRLLKDRFEIVRGCPFEGIFDNFIYVRRDLL